MRRTFFSVIILLVANIFSGRGETITAPESPFGFEPLSIYEFPLKDFPITRFGAKKGNAEATQKAFAKAMEACNKAGGGRVVVPPGEWVTGPVAFKSNCNLHISEGARLVFSDDLKLFPIVRTTWEAMEVLNYSPLIYAFECENIALTGRGTIEAKMDLWREWYGWPESQLAATRKIATMASIGIPYDQRKAYEEGSMMRPQFVEFNRCVNVQLSGFRLRNSPMWCLHLFMCKDVWVHNLDVHAEGNNPDGLDIDMTQHAVVEECEFYSTDDAICFKAGRNKDAWDLATPTQDVVVRNCNIENGGSIMTAGSELSGGIMRIYVHHCTGNIISHILRVKTNERRGGEVCDILVEDCHANSCRAVLSINTDVMYQYRTLIPTFEVRKTLIHDLEARNVSTDFAEVVCEIIGDEEVPVKGIKLNNVHVKEVSKTINKLKNVEDLVMEGIIVDDYSKSGKKYLAPSTRFTQKK